MIESVIEFNEPDTQVIRCSTLQECINLYLGNDINTEINELSLPQERLPVDIYLAVKDKIGCWGWCSKGYDKNVIYLWVSNKASRENIIRLLSHELGHLCPAPYIHEVQDFEAEERRARQYEEVAFTAFLWYNKWFSKERVKEIK